MNKSSRHRADASQFFHDLQFLGSPYMQQQYSSQQLLSEGYKVCNFIHSGRGDEFDAVGTVEKDFHRWAGVLMAGIKAALWGIVAFSFVVFILGVKLHGGDWVIPVATLLAVMVGFGDLFQSREKRVKRIQQEEVIREQVRRQMRDE